MSIVFVSSDIMALWLVVCQFSVQQSNECCNTWALITQQRSSEGGHMAKLDSGVAGEAAGRGRIVLVGNVSCPPVPSYPSSDQQCRDTLIVRR